MSDSPERLTHLDASGAARMVDVGQKAKTERMARAAGLLRMQPATRQALIGGTGPKGDALQVARVAGIMAAKRTAELIPLCHPLPLTSVQVDFEATPDGIAIYCQARTRDRTGVEMEALVGASVAGLTLYDMGKALEKGMVLERVQLQEKTGGSRGDWVRTEP